MSATSLARAALILGQAALNHAATRNPNPAPKDTRYALDSPSLLQIAPLIFHVRPIPVIAIGTTLHMASYSPGSLATVPFLRPTCH
jgi:hypothetical protein